MAVAIWSAVKDAEWRGMEKAAVATLHLTKPQILARIRPEIKLMEEPMVKVKYADPVKQAWHQIKDAEERIRIAEADKERREREYFESVLSSAKARLSRAATEFLKANGFTGGGEPRGVVKVGKEKFVVKNPPKTTMGQALAKAFPEES